MRLVAEDGLKQHKSRKCEKMVNRSISVIAVFNSELLCHPVHLKFISKIKSCFEEKTPTALMEL